MSRLAVVANRLPVSLRRSAEGLRAHPSSGGLVSALSPALDRARGLWIGWPGIAADPAELAAPLAEASRQVGYDIVPVHVPEDEVDPYYAGFSNSVLWPLFHGFPERCALEPEYFDAYLRVNERFADVLEDSIERGDRVWVHDYHLVHLGQLARERGLDAVIGYFLHIPFPQPESFLRLPWRAELLEALCAYDLIGFQTERDRSSFLQCLSVLRPETSIGTQGDRVVLEQPGRRTVVGVFPISIDYQGFTERAQSEPVRERLADLRLGLGDTKVLLGVDRLDYTKGLLARLEAWERVLERRPDLHGKAVLLQLVVPSRGDVPEYRAIKSELEELTGRIVGRFSTPQWTPVQYLYKSVPRDELVALYRLADVALVTPLCDGMNLVAKEFCASRVDERGALVLSESAGAAAELAEHSLIVNPFDTEDLARAIEEGLAMDDADQVERMRALRSVVERHDVFRWADEYLGALGERPSPRTEEPDTDEHPWTPPALSWAQHGLGGR